LRLALKGCGVRPSATVLANEFNLRYWGESITVNTARNWLLGKSIPMQDKLRVLADWLHVSADELRFGTLAPAFKAEDCNVDMSVLSMQDRDMLSRYMALALEDRKTVCDVVTALRLAATVKVIVVNHKGKVL
jgi:transcriptional regulator with XRE-family HTH domain